LSIPAEHVSHEKSEYGSDKATTPFVTSPESDELAIALVASEGEESPDGWTDDIAVGPSDTITWTELPCTDGILDGTTVEPATPFAIGE
jgi:hypothetical protein